MSKLIEIAPQTLVVQGVTIVFGRHTDESRVEEEGTAFVQVSRGDKDEAGEEITVGSTVFFNDDGTVHSEVEHGAPVKEESPPDPQMDEEGSKSLEETTV